MKTALITGITGQDGYYLAELLLEKGYEVQWYHLIILEILADLEIKCSNMHLLKELQEIMDMIL